MNLFRDSSLSDFTRGGQTTLHFFRMIGQVISKFSQYLVLFYVGVVGIIFYAQTEEYERYVVARWSLAWFYVQVMKEGEIRLPIDLASGRTVTTTAGAIYRDRTIAQAVERCRTAMVKGITGSLVLTAVLFILALRFVFRAGNTLRQESFLRGASIVDSESLRKLLRKNKAASAITIAGIPLVKGSETSNILLTGSPGTGKSVVIRDLIKQLRARGERAIIYSSSGEFIEQYYREGTDILLNPLDQRCPAWDVWAECHTPPDYDSLTASLIPESVGNSDPFWVMAPRMLFSSVAMKLAEKGRPTNKDLLKILLTENLNQVAKIVKGTTGATLLAEGAEKTALSVRASLAPFINPLKYLKESENCFSIKKWVNNDVGDECIFISSRSDQKEILKPLISLWLDIATSAVMSLEPDQQRRIWLIIDELPSLNRLPSLLEFLPQGRKYGGCGVISFQSFAQLVSLYSLKGAEAITGMCDTWVAYRVNEPATAEWLSKAMGTAEVKETNEGISYGANEIRDGATVSLSRKARSLVLASELMNLPNLQGYLRVQGAYPVAKFKSDYTRFEKIAKGYVPAVHDVSFLSDSGDATSDSDDDTNVINTHLNCLDKATALSKSVAEQESLFRSI